MYDLGYYCTGDGAHRDLDGDYAITGRMDDVVNVSGHRLGTAEIEDVLVRVYSSKVQFTVVLAIKLSISFYKFSQNIMMWQKALLYPFLIL